MKRFVITTLSLLALVVQVHVLASPSYQSLELNLEDSRQLRFEKQIRKQLAFHKFYSSSITTDSPASPGEIDPTKEVLIFLRDHGKTSLDTYLETEKKTCWVIYDFEQFQLSYTSLDNISQKFPGNESEFRAYFYELQDYIEIKTGESAEQYIRKEKRKIKKLAKKLGCKR